MRRVRHMHIIPITVILKYKSLIANVVAKKRNPKGSNVDYCCQQRGLDLHGRTKRKTNEISC
jgi:hypothetical protein